MSTKADELEERANRDAARATPTARELLFRVLRPVASLRLTVVLFALSIVLVFFGTMAQINSGIWTVVEDYFRSWTVWIPLQLVLQFLQVFFSFDRSLRTELSVPFPAGWTIGWLMFVNLLAAHLVRFKMSWKRSGIWTIHIGMVTLLLGEFFTGLYAVEGVMTIVTGETAGYVEHTRKFELAIVKSIDDKHDDVVVVPGSILRAKIGAAEPLAAPELPFTIAVDNYMVNSKPPRELAAGELNPATAGLGQELIVDEAPEISGTEPDQKIDAPSLYLTLKNPETGEALGTYLVTYWMSHKPQKVTVGDATYEIAYRLERDYKPYSLTLKNFEHKVYPGTDKPKDFASTVQLVDASRGENREVRIWMNNPLFYAGETFYQSSFLRDDAGTVLQVVRNPVWWLPYVSCVLMTVGMLIHFLLNLSRFLKRQKAPGMGQARQANGTSGAGIDRLFPWIVAALGGLGVLLLVVPPPQSAKQFDFYAFGKIPTLEGGRVKPLDTFARTSLTSITDRSEFIDDQGEHHPATKWLLDVLVSKLAKDGSGTADKQQIFRVTHPQVREVLGLEDRKGMRYSYAEIAPKERDLEREAQRAVKIEPAKQTIFDVKVMEVAKKVQLYKGIAELMNPAILPPQPNQGDELWMPIYIGYLMEQRQGAPHPQFREFVQIIKDYVENEPAAFNKSTGVYLTAVEKLFPDATAKSSFEVFFNHFAPFYTASMFYALAFVLAILSWLVWHEPLRRAAFLLALVTLAVHTFGLLTRMYLQGRPPVTNLYSSAVFIGWGTTIFCLILESLYRNGIGNALTAVLGGLTMIIAHHLAGSGDTMEMMQAVLDTNFWLATHVTCVTLGYSATFVAGMLGCAYLILGIFTNTLTKDGERTLAGMLYGVVCFATLLSFVGTVLGGIWADVSWGRFWGWDPKENGAVLIVIWNALILHARWSGLVKTRGVAMLTLVGNMITAWSWFGTNQLGVGLHAYGFNNTLAVGCRYFWISQLVLIAPGVDPEEVLAERFVSTKSES